MPRSANLLEAIQRGERCLLAGGDADGGWRDYALEPGASDAWSTAFVGCALAEPPLGERSLPVLRRAAEHLHELRTEGGWGYNPRTATDADSTAWSLALLALLDDFRGLDPLLLLSPYIEADGAVRTFLDRDRFGSWADPHPEVTAFVGSLLIALEAPLPLLELVRARCREWRAGGSWPSFWWTSSVYSTAQAVRFLSAGEGGVESPAQIAAWAERQLQGRPSSFELAELLRIGVELGETGLTAAGLRRLLETQGESGGWAPSPILVVPAQRGAGRQVAADVRGLMSTAAAVGALKAAGRAQAIEG